MGKARSFSTATGEAYLQGFSDGVEAQRRQHKARVHARKARAYSRKARRKAMAAAASKENGQ